MVGGLVRELWDGRKEWFLYVEDGLIREVNVGRNVSSLNFKMVW